MGIGPIYPMQPEEPAAAGASSQASLTRRDRELQVEDGQPPLEVPETELESLHLREGAELLEKWKKRYSPRRDGQAADADEAAAEIDETEDAVSETMQAEAEPDEQPKSEYDERLPKTEFEEEESTGRLFDGRS